MTDFIQYVKDIDKRLKKLEVNAIIRNLKIPDTGSFVVPVSSSAPASPVQGQIYYDTTDSKFKGYNGSTWVDLN